MNVYCQFYWENQYMIASIIFNLDFFLLYIIMMEDLVRATHKDNYFIDETCVTMEDWIG